MTDKMDAVNPFVPGTDIRIPGATSGPLAGLTFAAKDLFDIAGFLTGGGSPDWPRDQPLPEKTRLGRADIVGWWRKFDRQDDHG